MNTLRAQEKGKTRFFFKLDGKYLFTSKNDEPKRYIIKNNYDARKVQFILKNIRM